MLGLQPLEACGYHPAATFNGQAASETPATKGNPSYYLLRRR